MSGGKIIFLHGASSSGKSHLATALQDQLPEPFWHISIDKLRDHGVLPTARFTNGDFDWRAHRDAFFEGYHQSLVAYARAGNNLIIEHIIEKPAWRPELAQLFAPFDFFFVKVDCPLDVLIAREKARGDRPAGSAEQDFRALHHGLVYDLDVDGTADTGTTVATIMDAWQNRTGQSRFFANGTR